MRTRWFLGLVGTIATTIIALDATVGKPTNYELHHKFFGEDWQFWRNLVYAIASLIISTCAYIGIRLNGKQNI